MLNTDKCPFEFEAYTYCGSGCGDLYCGDDPNNRTCTTTIMCREGCYCIEGYVRNYKSICVPIEDCASKLITFLLFRENYLFFSS